MPKPYPRKERLEELIGLARTYRRWTDQRLAFELGRNVHNLVPGSGVPKLDLVMRLAEALDWPVDVVVRELCDPHQPDAREVADSGTPPVAMLRNAHVLFESGRQLEAADLAEAAFQAAPGESELQVQALLLQCGCFDQIGYYNRSAEVLQRGLRACNGSGYHAPWLRANLASMYYILGQYPESEALASAVIAELSDIERADPRRQALGTAHAVRGDCLRVRAGAALAGQRALAELSLFHLEAAAETMDDYAVRGGPARDGAIAEICRGGRLEMRALIGLDDPGVNVAAILDAIDLTHVQPRRDAAPWLESLGWWCVFGCNVAMRHVGNEDELQLLMAILTNKADEIAEKLGNWALREHVWAMEHTRRRMRESGGVSAEEWVLDADDLRVVTGAIGRFPVFRSTGWQILRSVRLVEE